MPSWFFVAAFGEPLRAKREVRGIPLQRVSVVSLLWSGATIRSARDYFGRLPSDEGKTIQHPAVTLRPAHQDGAAREGLDFEVHEVDLSNKSEEFLSASPTGKVPVVVVDGDSLYESNVVNQYLDEVTEGSKLMPEDPKSRAYARIWMASADVDFFPALFVASVGRERGFSEGRISEALEKLQIALEKLEERLHDRDYLAGEFSLADKAYAGNFVRLRHLERRGEVHLKGYPNVSAWIERLEGRKSYKAAV